MIKRKRLQRRDMVGQKKTKLQCGFSNVSLNIAFMAGASLKARVKKRKHRKKVKRTSSALIRKVANCAPG